MPVHLNQTQAVNLSDLTQIATTTATDTSSWVYTPSTTTSSSIVFNNGVVYIKTPGLSFVSDGQNKVLESRFFRPQKEKPRELTDEELVKVLNS